MTIPPTSLDSPDLEYPCSDDEPMSDSDSNWIRMVRTTSALKQAMAARGVTAYVSSDLFVYPVQGRPNIRCAPDVFVAPGSVQHLRGVFKCWEEAGSVDFAGEFISIRDRERFDSPRVVAQVAFYRDVLCTRELFLFEPHGLPMNSPFAFKLLRLSGGQYAEVRPGPGGWYPSEVLALELRPGQDVIELRDPVTRERYLPREDSEAARAEREAARAEHEAARADAAEARLRALEDELRRRS